MAAGDAGAEAPAAEPESRHRRDEDGGGVAQAAGPVAIEPDAI